MLTSQRQPHRTRGTANFIKRLTVLAAEHISDNEVRLQYDTANMCSHTVKKHTCMNNTYNSFSQVWPHGQKRGLG